MTDKYRIVSAKPKKATNHCNSSFKMVKWVIDPATNKGQWVIQGWMTINQVSDLLRAGDEVKTAEITGTNMTHGDAVELELRIVHNGTKFKISQMPDT